MQQLSLQEADPEVAALIAEEEKRQREGIELIASENFTSAAVLQCLGSCLTNKYSEGQPGQRYYGGNVFIDKIELLCKKRALEAFSLDPQEWHVNVQSYSGSPANFAAYTAFLNPHDRIMGLDLPSGGHLTHGFYTAKKRISATSIYFESLPYQVNMTTGIIDYDALLRQATLFRPKLIIAGTSAYARKLDYAAFRKIADAVGSILMADMAHIAGLIAAGVHPSPFGHCDLVTSTTHKTLRGPRGGLIFVNLKRLGAEAKDKLDMAVFPGLQGGPHNSQIAGMACQFKEVATPEFKEYTRQTVANARALAAHLISKGQTLATGGTDNHLILWDLRPHGLTGSKVEKVADEVGITINKNTVPGDLSAMSPSGVRIGVPAMTTRGCKEEDFETIGDLLLECVDLALKIQEKSGKKLTDFEAGVAKFDGFESLRERVKQFASARPYPAPL